LLPSSPRTGFVLAICALIGLILGALAAIILEALNPRVRSRRMLERLLGVRVIGRVPRPALPQPRLLLARATQ
jgi:capsular polysaccharide biosynthesis protein